MGADIWLFCEVCTIKQGKKNWIPVNLAGWDDPRDYELFYLLGGVRGYGNSEQDTYPPIAPCKGLPEDVNPMTIDHERMSLEAADAVSYYTLKELKASRYSGVMKVKGWVDEKEFCAAATAEGDMRLDFYSVHPDAPPWEREGLVLREWDGILNGNLVFLVRQMERVMRERQISSEEDIRIIFWIT